METVFKNFVKFLQLFDVNVAIGNRAAVALSSSGRVLPGVRTHRRAPRAVVKCYVPHRYAASSCGRTRPFYLPRTEAHGNRCHRSATPAAAGTRLSAVHACRKCSAIAIGGFQRHRSREPESHSSRDIYTAVALALAVVVGHIGLAELQMDVCVAKLVSRYNVTATDRHNAVFKRSLGGPPSRFEYHCRDRPVG